jgi:hypothetical protein
MFMMNADAKMGGAFDVAGDGCAGASELDDCGVSLSFFLVFLNHFKSLL